MIFTKAPYRISFFGGGTDYPGYYLKHGGSVLGGAIDKYCYLNIRNLSPYFDYKHRFVYSDIELPSTIDEIKHPSIRESLRHLKFDASLSIHHDGDIPAKSGMGSSSAFTAALLKGILAAQGKIISKHELGLMAIHVEQNMIKESVGSQDQMFAAHGGLNKINFLQSGEITVEPVIIGPERLAKLESSFMLFYTGISRFASEIASDQIQKIDDNTSILHEMKSYVDDAYMILTNNNIDLDEFGSLLNETWTKKRQLSGKISNPIIDDMYQLALKNGAVGGKLLGAGGGGFMLFYAQPEHHAQITKALKDYLLIPFKFEFEGASIPFYSSF